MADEIITSEKPKLTAEQMVVHDTGEYSMLFDSAKFNQAWRVATAFAQSGLVPDHFKNNINGVFVVLHMATRMNLDPFMVLQKTYLVHGRPGMEAQLVIALVNARGPFQGPIQWETSGEGDKRQWIAYATHAKTGERCEAKVDWAMVKAEGWFDKAGSKWKTIPDLMGRYRSATFLARLYCPEVIMGLSTADELDDMAFTLDSGVTVSPRPPGALIEIKEVDPAALAEFARILDTQGFADKNEPELFDKFLGDCAKSFKITVDEVKAMAGTQSKFDELWATFTQWKEKHGPKDEGKKKASANEPSEPPAMPPTEEQRTELEKIPEDILVKAFKAAKVDYRPISELDGETAGKVLQYARLL